MRALRPTRSLAPSQPTAGTRPGRARLAVSFGFLVALVVAACGSVGIFDVPGDAPSGAAPTTPPPTPTPRQTVSLPTLSPAPSFQLYTVRRGDTLLSIAERFRTSVLSLSYWNRERYASLDPDAPGYAPGRIETGWLIQLIPGTEADPEDFLPEPSESPTPVPSTDPTTGEVGGATATPPPATAAPTPRPSPMPSPTPSPTTPGPSVLLGHGPRTSHQVALTLDMGGRLDPAIQIMDWLIANDVKATIFPTGVMGTTTIGRQVLARVKAHPELFALGNHSWDHPDFRNLDAAAIATQLTRCENAVAPLAGHSTTPFFRPPFGGQDAAVRAAVGAAGWHYTVMWDIDAIDWRPESDGGPTADEIVTKVLGNARGGSIVLMHLGGYHTLEALPRIVDGLRAGGLVPVRLSDWYR
jgi:peptidoglycan/xylan/chitin deacetylase (PgdA/CDA1 family)